MKEREGEERVSLPAVSIVPCIWCSDASLSVDNLPLGACGARQCHAESRLWTLAAEMKSVPMHHAATPPPRLPPENVAPYSFCSGFFVSARSACLLCPLMMSGTIYLHCLRLWLVFFIYLFVICHFTSFFLEILFALLFVDV